VEALLDLPEMFGRKLCLLAHTFGIYGDEGVIGAMIGWSGLILEANDPGLWSSDRIVTDIVDRARDYWPDTPSCAPKSGLRSPSRRHLSPRKTVRPGHPSPRE
jgi:hypothetical protein